MNSLRKTSRPRAAVLALQSLLATIIILCCLPLDTFSNDHTVEILATGKKNPKALASEVWISAFGDDEDARALMEAAEAPGGWERQGGMVLTYQRQPALLAWKGQLGPGSRIKFASHFSSGIVQLTIDGRTSEYDLYGPDKEGERIVPLRELLDGGWTSGNLQWSSFSVVFGGLFCVVFLLRIWIHRVGTQITPSDRATVFTSSWPLLAAPSLLIYGSALLAFWPGVLSPDSMAELNEVNLGYFPDTYTVLHSAFVWATTRFYFTPAIPVAIQAFALATGSGLALAELRNWRVPLSVLMVAAVLLPLFPANFMMAVILWKDVFFAACAVYLFWLTLVLVRTEGRALRSPAFTIGIGAAILGFSLSRQNALPAAVIFPLLVAIIYRKTAWRRAATLTVACAIVVAGLRVLMAIYPSMQLHPAYRTINAVHIIGAYISAGVVPAHDDLAFLETVMPLDRWKSAYDCQHVGALFFYDYTDRLKLAADYVRVNRIALGLIKTGPSIWLKHQICVTNMLWKILPIGPKLLVLPILESQPLPHFEHVAFPRSSLAPGLVAPIQDIREWSSGDGWIALFWRPAWALLLLSGVVIFLSASARRLDLCLLALPSWLNTASLALLIGAPDYRYQYSVVVLALLTVPLLFAGRREPVS
jgi:hypothetical protein